VEKKKTETNQDNGVPVSGVGKDQQRRMDSSCKPKARFRVFALLSNYLPRLSEESALSIRFL
jgi:hypothetical protein